MVKQNESEWWTWVKWKWIWMVKQSLKVNGSWIVTRSQMYFVTWGFLSNISRVFSYLIYRRILLVSNSGSKNFPAISKNSRQQSAPSEHHRFAILDGIPKYWNHYTFTEFNFQRETTKIMLRLVERFWNLELWNFEVGNFKEKKCEIHSKKGSWKSRIFDFQNPEN